MELEGKPITVDLIAGIAAGALQYMAVQSTQTAWETYAKAIHDNGALDATFKSDTDAFAEAIAPAFMQAKIAAVVGAAIQLLDW